MTTAVLSASESLLWSIVHLFIRIKGLNGKIFLFFHKPSLCCLQNLDHWMDRERLWFSNLVFISVKLNQFYLLSEMTLGTPLSEPCTQFLKVFVHPACYLFFRAGSISFLRFSISFQEIKSQFTGEGKAAGRLHFQPRYCYQDDSVCNCTPGM